MPQKPQDRAKDKRRLTRRLERWRAKQDAAQAAPPAAAAPPPAPDAPKAKKAAKPKAS